MRNSPRGFTLIEMMIVIAIMAIISSIAIPMYSQFVREAEVSTARMNMDSLRTFLEDFFLDNNTYVGTTGNWAADESDTSLRDSLGWEPSGDGKQYNYFVVGQAATYSIVVESISSNVWARCEDRMDKCCTSETPGATKAACP